MLPVEDSAYDAGSSVLTASGTIAAHRSPLQTQQVCLHYENDHQ